MNLSRIPYRLSQFWYAVTAAPAPQDLEQARTILSPGELQLFMKMQPGEQAHALRVLNCLRRQGESEPRLLQAALLHDVGKIRYRLNPWQRGLIVLTKKISPGAAQRWGESEPAGWRAAFTVAAQHPAWGASLAEAAGSDPLTVSLVRRHQEHLNQPGSSLEERLLQKLQAADEQS